MSTSKKWGETKYEYIVRLRDKVRRLESGNTVIDLQEEIEELQESVADSRKDALKHIDSKQEVIQEYKKLALENKKETEIALVRLEGEFEIKEIKLKAETHAERAKVIAEIRENSQVRVDELKTSEADASARYDEAANLAESLVTQNTQLQSVIDALLKKLPNVDLTKMNVNVEVPAQTTVNVKK